LYISKKELDDLAEKVSQDAAEAAFSRMQEEVKRSGTREGESGRCSAGE